MEKKIGRTQSRTDFQKRKLEVIKVITLNEFRVKNFILAFLSV